MGDSERMTVASPEPRARPVVRDRTWVEREYGTDKWPLVRERIAAACAELGPDAGVAAVVGHVRAAGTGTWRGPVDAVLAGTRLTLDAAAVRGAHRELVVGSVLDRCREDTDLICELGSGWGHLLVSVWASGGPPDATYVAAELTAAGRACSDALARIEPTLDLVTVPFDHTRPDLAGLGGRRRHAVVYTCHSVEQVAELGEGWIDAICGVAEEVDVVHVEPVGWQTGRPSHSSRAHAEQHDYNRDLVEVVRSAEASGRIHIDELVVDAVGVNPSNPSTVLGWHSSPTGSALRP